MSAEERVTLVRGPDGGLYVERCWPVTLEPVAMRLWWPVKGWRADPFRVGALGELPVGEPVRSLGQIGGGGEYKHDPSGAIFFLPLGGQTVASHRWEATIPAPRGKPVASEGWAAQPGQATYAEGCWWVVQKSGRRKPVVLSWDELAWRVLSA